MARQFRIAHARIQLEPWVRKERLVHSTSRYLHSSLNQLSETGAQVTRYTRTWKLSKRTELAEGLWAGYLVLVTRSGAVPFLISEKNHLVSFQLLPRLVQPTAVTSILQSLLNAAEFPGWKVTLISVPKSFDEWLDTVAGIAKFDISLTYPNPNWAGREKVERLVEELKAETVTVKAKAFKDSYIDTNSDWFRQAMDHVMHGYGRAILTGPDKDTGIQSKFAGTIDGELVPMIHRIRVSDYVLEAPTEALQQAQNELIETYSFF